MQLQYFTFQHFLNEKKNPKELPVFIFLNVILEELFDAIFYKAYYENKMQKVEKNDNFR